jgi:hypothetical protein
VTPARSSVCLTTGGLSGFGLGWGATVLRPYKSRGVILIGLKQNRRSFVAAVGGFFAVLVDVLDYALEDQQVGSALAG